MKRPAPISQNARVFVTAAVIAVGAIGCWGGGGDAKVGAGTGGTACSLADVNQIFMTTTTNTGCTVIGVCHDNAGAAAGLDLTSAGWQTKLVGRGPSATAGASASLKSMCAGKNLVYLKAGSNPATGLFLDKVKPNAAVPCGVHMPNLGTMLTAAQFDCVQSFANTLTK